MIHIRCGRDRPIKLRQRDHAIRVDSLVLDLGVVGTAAAEWVAALIHLDETANRMFGHLFRTMSSRVQHRASAC